MDTYHLLSNIYDYAISLEKEDDRTIMEFASKMRRKVDNNSLELRMIGESIIEILESAFRNREGESKREKHALHDYQVSSPTLAAVPDHMEIEETYGNQDIRIKELLSIAEPIPYSTFKKLIQ
jgi:hypothetical protein